VTTMIAADGTITITYHAGSGGAHVFVAPESTCIDGSSCTCGDGSFAASVDSCTDGSCADSTSCTWRTENGVCANSGACVSGSCSDGTLCFDFGIEGECADGSACAMGQCSDGITCISGAGECVSNLNKCILQSLMWNSPIQPSLSPGLTCSAADSTAAGIDEDSDFNNGLASCTGGVCDDGALCRCIDGTECADGMCGDGTVCLSEPASICSDGSDCNEGSCSDGTKCGSLAIGMCNDGSTCNYDR
jgi:hypothetical protein